MLTTLTPNPSFDRTVTVPTLGPGEVHRAQAVTNEAGGKGVNVARAIARSGRATRAIVPANNTDLISLTRLLQADAPSVELVGVPIDGDVRTNISLVDADGVTTKVNERGPTLTETDADRMIEACRSGAVSGDWLVACGSLPPGLASDFYVQLCDAVRSVGLRVALDTSGDALTEAVQARCALIKPNDEELGALVGRELTTFGDVIDAAESLLDRGVEAALVSLGAAGALLVTPDSVVHARTPPTSIRNTVGAGDALLAGFVESSASDPEANGADALRAAVTWGRAAARSATTAFPTPEPSDANDVMIDVAPVRSTTLEST